MKQFVLATLLALRGLAAAFVIDPTTQQPLVPMDDLPVDQLPVGAGGRRPNIVFILVDDQDLYMDSLSYTPIARKELMEKGTFFQNHFVTTALCCPSRVSLFTGRQAHNTNVTDINPPHGGYPKFVRQGFNENWLPVWMQQAGYNTYYTGKLFNMHTVLNYHSPFVKGFNESDFLLDPFTYMYMNSTYQRNHDPPVSYEGFHSTDVLAVKAYGQLADALSRPEPFFLTIAPAAPHSNVELKDKAHPMAGLRSTAPIPQQRYADHFPGVKVPRTPHFNPDTPSGVNWIAGLPQQNESNVAYNDDFYRRRLQVMQGPDEIIGGVVRMLERHGALDNTYIIYSSDNGYHIGQHRLQPGKECGFEEDIRVPLFIRGPGVPANHTVDSVTTHIDLAPTIFNMAGLDLRDDFDGTPLPLTQTHMEDEDFQRHEHVGIEYWGLALGEGTYGSPLRDPDPMIFRNNTYKALRVLGDGYDLYYSVWCNNKHQLYNLLDDPYELHNLYSNGDADVSGPEPQVMGAPLSKVIARLDALTFVLKSCKGETCIKPWAVLHPNRRVASLRDALASDFDAFYTAQHKVYFDRCEEGYILDAEGPQLPLIYRDGLSWSEWA